MNLYLDLHFKNYLESPITGNDYCLFLLKQLSIVVASEESQEIQNKNEVFFYTRFTNQNINLSDIHV